MTCSVITTFKQPSQNGQPVEIQLGVGYSLSEYGKPSFEYVITSRTGTRDSTR
nr:hypothetical protein [uncultured Methanospirillum sp.]